MQGDHKLQQMFALSQEYADLHKAYRARGTSRVLDPHDKEWAGPEEWRIPHYFDVGVDAIRICVAALVANVRPPPCSVLDFPSGSGRVTRHFRSFFPNAEITACDLYEHHVDFCRQTFGVLGSYSKADLDQLDLRTSFDLIFCGSLLTHLPEPQFLSALKFISRSLSFRGIAIVTLQGRHSLHIQKYKWKYVSDELFAVAQTEFESRGFGYVDYNHNFKEKFNKQDQYGIALASPTYVAGCIARLKQVRLLGYHEREWDNHQDVVVIGKPSLKEEASAECGS